MEVFGEILSGFFYFIIMIGVLVFVHEGGHFIFAKLFKVKVHVFSLGFGPKIAGFQKGETFYKISLIPIGGYVKMLGEDPAEELAPEDKGRAFSDKPIWQRFFIITGGPVMNIIFPLFLHFGVGLSFTQVTPAHVGIALEGSPASKAGLVPGDIITAVNDEIIDSFSDLVHIVSKHPEEKMVFTIKRDSKSFKKTIIPEKTMETVVLDVKRPVGRIGISPSYPRPLIGVSDPLSPAHTAGLKTFDLVIRAGGIEINKMLQLEKILLKNRGQTLKIAVKKFKDNLNPSHFYDFENMFGDEITEVTLNIPSDITDLLDVGIENSRDFVAFVSPKGPAYEVGIRTGDKLISLDGKKYPSGQILSAIDKNPDKASMLSWSRDGKMRQVSFKPHFIPAGEAGELGIKRDAYDKGMWALGPGILPDKISNPSLFVGALKYAYVETYAGLEMIGLGFKLLFTGKVSMRSLGGPIMIGQLAGKSGRMGASAFVWMMALISLNLGLLNLLPIPVLDGGQIVFLGVEAVTRRSLSVKIKERIMLVGIAMLLVLMVFATWNDFARLLVG